MSVQTPTQESYELNHLEEQTPTDTQLHQTALPIASEPVAAVSPAPTGHGTDSQTNDPPIVVQPARRSSSDRMMQTGMTVQSVHVHQVENHTDCTPVRGSIPYCPPGLEYLASTDQLLVHQRMDLLEVITSIPMANLYDIKNTLGQNVYSAEEKSYVCNRMCCGSLRSFDMKVLDLYQNEVLHFQRDLRCQSCCFPCCLQKLEVSSPPGTVIGTVEQKWTLLGPELNIKDQHGQTVLTIWGSCWLCTLRTDAKLHIRSIDGEEVGTVTRQWSGCLKHCFTNADNYHISFPMDLDVKVKATLLGALHLIDYMLFENRRPLKITRMCFT